MMKIQSIRIIDRVQKWKNSIKYLYSIFFMAFCLILLWSGEAKADGAEIRLYDNLGLLSEEEAESISVLLDEISQKYKVDIGILTVETLDGTFEADYAEKYYEEYNFGFGKEKDGLLLLIAMEERVWYIATRGYAIDAFTDAGIEYIGEQCQPLLTDEKYYKAFHKYAKLCDDFIKAANQGKPYDVGNMPKGNIPVWALIVDFLVAIGGAFVVAQGMASNSKTVRYKAEAKEYVVPGSLNFVIANQIMVDKRTSSRTINRSSSSGGGSSTHSSSSGNTYGGGGGHF